MRLKNASETELAGLPEPTAADIEALERAERYNKLDAREYLDLLTALTKDLPAPRETNSDSDEPFTL